MRARVVAVVAAAVTSACVQQSALLKRSIASMPPPPAKIINSPPLNTDTEVEIGSSLVLSEKRKAVPAIKLTEAVTHAGTNLGNSYVLTIPRGTLIAAGTDGTGTFYEADRPLEFQNQTAGVTILVHGGVYIPAGSPMATEIFWRATNNFVQPLNDTHPGINFEPTIADLSGDDNFRRELVYGGVSQGTIAILYREFMNDMARPAFSQELKYDLAKGDVIGYRGARFQVLSVTNTGIRYKVLKHLE